MLKAKRVTQLPYNLRPGLWPWSPAVTTEKTVTFDQGWAGRHLWTVDGLAAAAPLLARFRSEWSWTIRHHQPPAQHRGHECGGLETCTYSAARLIRTPHLGLSLLQLRVSSCCDNSQLMMTSTLSLRRTSTFINEYRGHRTFREAQLSNANLQNRTSLNRTSVDSFILILIFSRLKPLSSSKVRPRSELPWSLV